MWKVLNQTLGKRASELSTIREENSEQLQELDKGQESIELGLKSPKNYSFAHQIDMENKRQELLRNMVKENINIDNEREVNALIEEAYKQYQLQPGRAGTEIKDNQTEI